MNTLQSIFICRHIKIKAFQFCQIYAVKCLTKHSFQKHLKRKFAVQIVYNKPHTLFRWGQHLRNYNWGALKSIHNFYSNYTLKHNHITTLSCRVVAFTSCNNHTNMRALIFMSKFAIAFICGWNAQLLFAHVYIVVVLQIRTDTAGTQWCYNRRGLC